ncbi:MAG TPA: hypothetical protein VHQ47_05985 [Phycisphaerae bacterium]|nr:hypothetical protein [Phycisphaerae bacterium]HVV72777.1 hypothetical protein [Verrucomicrobiae bacterium]
MTDDQANQLIQLLTSIQGQLATLLNIGMCVALAASLIWGTFLWRMIILSKNQRNLW